MTEKPWYLGPGEGARQERVRRGLETPAGNVLALTEWEAEREQQLARAAIEREKKKEDRPSGLSSRGADASEAA